jgi:hypothetical protein
VRRRSSEGEKNEKLLHQMIAVTRQLSNIQEGALNPMPITPLSEQEKEILRLFLQARTRLKLHAL